MEYLGTDVKRLKWILQEQDGGCGLESSVSRYRQASRCRKDSNFLTGWKIVDSQGQCAKLCSSCISIIKWY
jgi:hypothetical protein